VDVFLKDKVPGIGAGTQSWFNWRDLNRGDRWEVEKRKKGRKENRSSYVFFSTLTGERIG
jgi:hypothetical protein